MLIYVVIVTYNGMHWIDRCLGSLRNSNVGIKTIVIDNSSTDNTKDFIIECYPEVELICSDSNLGFGKANNIGLNRALMDDADFVFLLNQDAWIKPDTIGSLCNFSLLNQDFGVISPVHLTAVGDKFEYKFYEYIQAENCPDLLEDLWFDRLKGLYEVNFVNAAAWLITKDCLLSCGGFDPIFAHYGEDVDFVQRLQFFNLKIGIAPSVYVHHDSKVKQWGEIMWDKKRMLTIYISEVKNINGSFRSNFLIFLKMRFDEITSMILYRNWRRINFLVRLNFIYILQLNSIVKARRKSLLLGAFLENRK